MIKYCLLALRSAFVIAAASFLVSACSGDQTKGATYPVVGTVDQTTMEQSAFAARSTYSGLLRFAANYAALPRCSAARSLPCSDQAAVAVLRRYDTAADIATKGATDLARSPTRSPLALANAVTDAQRAVSAFKAAIEALSPGASIK